MAHTHIEQDPVEIFGRGNDRSEFRLVLVVIALVVTSTLPMFANTRLLTITATKPTFQTPKLPLGQKNGNNVITWACFEGF